MAEELDDMVRENASEPRRARGDSGEIRLDRRLPSSPRLRRDKSADRWSLLDLLEKAMGESQP